MFRRIVVHLSCITAFAVMSGHAATTPISPDDPSDPFVIAQATTLHNDPAQIYAFVRDQIKYEAYAGALRGARGTLWAMAGNTLDRAALLSAMLQASGYTTHYQHTTLNSTPAGQQLIPALLRRMFPATPVLLGCLPLGTTPDDPSGNSAAYYSTADYFWVQYGPANIDLDPNILNGQPGQTVQAPDASYPNIPQSEQQQVTVKMNVEQFSQASGLFGFGPTTTTVLTQSFYTWQLAGNILSVGNIVQSTVTGGLDISATTFTYTPYLLIGSGGADVTQDTILTGTDYQEFFTTIALSSTIITGIFVEVDANDAHLQQQHVYTHTLLDRLGPAARQGNASVQLNVPATPSPAVTNFDIATLNILPTRLNLATFQTQQARVNLAYQNYEAATTAFQALPSNGTPLTPAQQLIAQHAANLSKYLLITVNEMVTMAYDGAADRAAGQLATEYYARIYPSSPRITIAHSSMDAAGQPLYSLDVLKNDMLVVDGQYQNPTTPFNEEVARGMIESNMEASILSQVTGLPAYDISSVVAALGDPHRLIGLSAGSYSVPADTNALSSTTLSADAQTLILEAVQNGDQVITPNQMVTVNGQQTVGWWETDQYGHTVSHFPNGNHQALVDYAGVNAFAMEYNGPIAQFIGFVEGLGITAYAFASAVLEATTQDLAFSGILKDTKNTLGGFNANQNLAGSFYQDFVMQLAQLAAPKNPVGLGTGLLAQYASGVSSGIEAMKLVLQLNIPNDPEVPTFLTAPLGPGPAGVVPGVAPGVTVNITTDPLFTMPYLGNELPVYDVNVVNTGPTTDTFSLQARDNSGNYRVGVSYPGSFTPSLTLAPGQAGQMNLCVLPVDTTGANVPAVGTPGSLQVTATGDISGVTATATNNYTVPAIPVLSLTVDPQVLTVQPGGTVQATITLGALGNASPGSVTLTAAADPGITINGLTTPVIVPLTGVTTEAVSFTAAGNAALNLDHVVFTASYTTGIGTQNVTFTLPVTVEALGTCSLNAALYAQQNKMTGLGNLFSALATDMNAAAVSPTNAALLGRVSGDISILNTTLGNISFLVSFQAEFAGAGTAVTSATPATLLAALTGLDAAVCDVATAINQASTYNTQIWLTTNSLVAGPNLPAVFGVNLYNPSSTMKVYNLTVSGVPAGVVSQFNFSSVTLTPGEATQNTTHPITLTLTPGASFTDPFTFNVVATPVGAPEFVISAPGSLLVRPQQISIDTVTATPAYGPPGTQFVITARVFAEVNENQQAYIVMQPYDSTGKATALNYSTPAITLTPTSTLQTVTIGTIDSTNFANGTYTLSVQGEFLNTAPIPGATSSGSILVGAPLSAILTANAGSTPPATVPPGNSTVQVALNLTRDATPNPVSTLLDTMAMQGIPRAMALYTSGQTKLAYVCSDSVVNIVDVTNPVAMVAKGTFAHDILTTENGASVNGFQVMACATYGTDFIISYSRYDGNTTAGTSPTHFATYSLANPLAPVQVGTVVDIQRPDSAGLYVAGNTALMFQSTTFYDLFDGFIESESGDIWAADLTGAPATGAVSYLNDVFSCGGVNAATNNCNNVTNVPAASFVGGVCTPNGTTPVPNDPARGGPYLISLGAAVNSTTSYFASTSASGGNTANPSCPQINGQLVVVDTSNPANPHVVTRVDAPPMTFMTGIAIQGNTAIGVGDSTGEFSVNAGYQGTLVVSSFDITAPQAPVLLDSITTQLADSAGSFVIPLGSNTFAVGNTTFGGNAQLVLIDASNPHALRYIPYNALFVANPAIAENGYFFALSSTPASSTNSLSAFQLSQINGPQITVKLQLPKGGNVAVDSNSFSLAPSHITAGATFDTYEWDQPTPNTITFNMNLTAVNAGDVPVVVTAGEVDYTLPSLGPGKIVFPPLTVLAQQILSISPLMQSVKAGSSATYVATLTNTTASLQTFVPYTIGIPASWGVQLPASVTVAAGATRTFNLVLTTALNTVPEVNYQFYLAVQTVNGITASVGAILTADSPPDITGGNPSTSFISFNASLSPAAITVGQGGTAQFQLLLTNTGNVGGNISSENSSPTFQSNPAAYNGWQLNFTPLPYAFVLPGLSNAVTLTGSVTVPPSYAPGSYPISVLVQNGTQTLNLTLTVNVVGPGVTALINPGSGSPSTTYQLTVNNTGNAADTYNLAIEGTLAQVATLPASTGPVAAGGHSQSPVTINPVNFVAPGNYTLQVKAVSQTNPAVVALATTTVTVSGSKSVSAAITPSPASVSSIPGSASLLFTANNTGNVPDTYTASIIATTGPVTATLNGGQSIASFPIPALGNSEFPLNATITGVGSATVTVKVTSLSNNSISGHATVSINNTTPAAPTAVALPTQANTPAHRLALLDASGSSDPNSLPLTYQWTLTGKPAGSVLSSASLSLAASAIAAYRPDVLGTYTFNVNVSNGTVSSNATASYTAIDAPPVAVTAGNFNIPTGKIAYLNGSNSYDPDGQPLSFAWSLVSAPAGSSITTASIYNSQTPSAFFTPDGAGAYQLQLIVSDPGASSPPAILTVTADSDGAVHPNAIAGPSQNIAVHSTATVSGSASYDPNTTPLALNYQWTLGTVPNGSTATLGNATSASAQFAPDVAGAYVVNLVVSNAHGSSAAATTTVYAYSGDVAPNANAGAGQFVTPTGTVNLSSQGSTDPDGGPLNLALLWWLDSLPGTSGTALQNPNTAAPTFVADRSGYYIARLEANDGLLAGFANTLVTSAATCDADANGVINHVDISLIAAAIGKSAVANDPRDFDRDGTITESDRTSCLGIVSGTALLQVSPGTITDTLLQGSAAVNHTLQISSTGDPLSFTVQSNQPWLTASVTSDSTGSISTLTATVTPGNLTPNTYQGMLTFTPSVGATQTVSATLTITAPGLLVTPTSFTENLVQGGAAVTESLQISSTGNPLNFTVGSDETWLTASINSGSTSTVSSLNAIVTPGALTPNTYTGHLTFTPATGAVQTVTVTLTVTAPGVVSPTPDTLTFNASYGGSAPPSQPVNVTSTGVVVNFTVTSDATWLTADSMNGATPKQLHVTATPGGLAPGQYTGHLTLTSGANTSSVTVTFNISETGSPCDVNADGLINVADVQKLVNEALGILAAGNDLNSDGKLNLVDMQIDINAVLGLGCSAH